MSIFNDLGNGKALKYSFEVNGVDYNIKELTYPFEVNGVEYKLLYYLVDREILRLTSISSKNLRVTANV
ncbi:hypothetical protein L2E82_00851 [Cichorium intybus]|uniref:Uncharacterized protein n=1 Tax=Cichorium intybus TaxID=13427 RepID=A0ACB9GXG7_CICIN|nr:hypothetical protein L2E82_00851 [Cichorium intybus]